MAEMTWLLGELSKVRPRTPPSSHVVTPPEAKPRKMQRLFPKNTTPRVLKVVDDAWFSLILADAVAVVPPSDSDSDDDSSSTRCFDVVLSEGAQLQLLVLNELASRRVGVLEVSRAKGVRAGDALVALGGQRVATGFEALLSQLRKATLPLRATFSRREPLLQPRALLFARERGAALLSVRAALLSATNARLRLAFERWRRAAGDDRQLRRRRTRACRTLLRMPARRAFAAWRALRRPPKRFAQFLSKKATTAQLRRGFGALRHWCLLRRQLQRCEWRAARARLASGFRRWRLRCASDRRAGCLLAAAWARAVRGQRDQRLAFLTWRLRAVEEKQRLSDETTLVRGRALRRAFARWQVSTRFAAALFAQFRATVSKCRGATALALLVARRNARRNARAFAKWRRLAKKKMMTTRPLKEEKDEQLAFVMLLVETAWTRSTFHMKRDAFFALKRKKKTLADRVFLRDALARWVSGTLATKRLATQRLAALSAALEARRRADLAKALRTWRGNLSSLALASVASPPASPTAKTAVFDDLTSVVDKLQALQRGIAVRKETRIVRVPRSLSHLVGGFKAPVVWLASPSLGTL